MPTNSAHPLHTNRLSVTAALAACALFLVLILFLRPSPTPTTPDLSDVPESDQWKYTAEGRAKHLAELQAHEQGVINSYSWVDQTKGVVHLPIERAMELVVLEHNPKH